MNNPHELKSYYESLVRNYKRLTRKYQIYKSNDKGKVKTEAIAEEIHIINEKILNFNKLFGDSIRKRNNSFGRFNIELYMKNVVGEPLSKKQKINEFCDEAEDLVEASMLYGYESSPTNSTSIDTKTYFKTPLKGNMNNPRNDNSHPGKRNPHSNTNNTKTGNKVNRGANRDYNYDTYAYGNMNYPRNYLAPSSAFYYPHPSNSDICENPGIANSYNYGGSGELENNGKYNDNSLYSNPNHGQHCHRDSKKPYGNELAKTHKSEQLTNENGNGNVAFEPLEEHCNFIDSTTPFKNVSEQAGDISKSRDRLESIIGNMKLKDKTRKFLLEMCRTLVENVCNTSCLISKNANKEIMDEEDIKKAFKLVCNVQFPDIARKFTGTDGENEHEKKMALLEKEKKRKSKI